MKKNLVRINEKQEKEILKYFGKDLPKDLTEQDINEQTRIIMQKFEKF